MLTRLYVNNYRCLVNFEFKPGRKQLVLGSNGSGKSTVFDVLSLLRNFSVRGEDCNERLVGATKTRWTEQKKQQFELDVTGNGGRYRYVLEVEEWNSPLRPKVVLEEVKFDGEPIFRFQEGVVHLYNDEHEDKVQYDFDWHRSALATIQDRWDNTKLTWFKKWLGGLFHVCINPWAMSSRSEGESREPEPDLSDFADWYRHLLLDEGSSVHKALIELKEVLQGFVSLDAKEAGLNVRYLQTTFTSAANGKPMQYHFSELSEGQRALIVLYLLNHCVVKSESTLLIDEPDNFIALAEIQPWLMHLLERVDDENSQVLLVSHHPELLDQLAAQGGIVFDRPEGLHTRVRPFESAEDTGLPPSELIARGWEGE